MRAWLKVLLSGAALAAVVPAAQAATIPVTTTADVVATNGQCSLREAVLQAGFSNGTIADCAPGAPGEDVVQLEAGDYRLSAVSPDEFGGDIDLVGSNAVRIAGRGMGATTITAVADRVSQVDRGARLGLVDLTVRDGLAGTGGDGGAIQNRGTLTALRVAFVNNAAGDGQPGTSFDEPTGQPGGGGGAIWSEGQLQVASSVFQSNRAARGADARHFVNPANPNNTIDVSARSGGSGGAILVSGGSAAITASTFTGSRAGGGGSNAASVPYAGAGDGGNGGAIAVTGGGATVENATFAGNTAGNAGSPRFRYNAPDVAGGSGGAVSAVAPGTMSVTFSTFTGNSVGGGPSGVVGSGAAVSGATVGASILADPDACATLAPAPLANVVLPGDASCPGAKLTGDPRLGPLGDNGGPTPTMLPGAGGPAIDVFSGVPCPAVDQRAVVRPQGAACEVGAVEVQPGIDPLPAAPVAAPTTTQTLAAKTLTPGALTSLRRISGVTLTRTAFRTYGRTKGTTLGVRLNIASSLVLTVTKPATGRRSKGKCVTPSGKLVGKPRCTRQVPLAGKITTAGKVGLNTIAFSGKLRGRALSPGAYTFVLTLPKLGTAKPVVATRGFRVIP